MTLKVTWRDGGFEPEGKPSPKFPNGIAVDLSRGATNCCTAMLPYPAKRIGHYLVECGRCGMKTMVTTAGRADDPRSVKVACKAPL